MLSRSTRSRTSVSLIDHYPLSYAQYAWIDIELTLAAHNENNSFREQQMALKIQGIANKMALLIHNLDADADKLNAGIDAAEAKRATTVSKAVGVVASAQQTLGDVDAVLTALDAITNGGPPLDDGGTAPPVGFLASDPADGSLERTAASGVAESPVNQPEAIGANGEIFSDRVRRGLM